MEALLRRRRCGRKTDEFRAAPRTTARTSTTCCPRRSRPCARRPSGSLGQRHFDVQIMGGAALHFGWVAEMKTGEGKTLVSDAARLPERARRQGRAPRHRQRLPRQARRRVDGPGLPLPRARGRRRRPRRSTTRSRSAARTPPTSPTARTTSSASTTCATTWPLSKDEQVQRGHFFAIVDEVDSILIDEARTPLIISGRVDDARSSTTSSPAIVKGLQRDRDYEVDEAKRTVVPTEDGIDRGRAGARRRRTSTSTSTRTSSTSSRPRCTAKELFKRDVDYVIQDGEVKIVDEFTGRILEGRRWSEGLHQAVEAKEGVKIKEENQTLATVTLQNYFRMYEKLSGMTGTAHDRGGRVRAHVRARGRARSRPTGRWSATTRPTSSTRPRMAKFDAVADDIDERHENGQPVLVGTISVEKSEKLSRAAREARHPALGAERQAARAGGAHRHPGRPARQRSPWPPTWPAAASTSCSAATPRASPRRSSSPRATTRRGSRRSDTRSWSTKFKDECAADGDQVRELGGLYVLGTERHESRRIDNQLRGRAGRQGDPGESRFYLSLEDELMRLFATGAMNWVMGKAFPDDVPLEAQDGHEGDRARAAHGRRPQLRDPQGRPQVRRGDERAAQGDLQAPPADPRRWRPPRRGVRGDRRRGRRTSSTDVRVRPSSPRSGTSTSCTPRSRASFPHADHARAARRLPDRESVVELLTDDAVELYEQKEQTIGSRHRSARSSAA